MTTPRDLGALDLGVEGVTLSELAEHQVVAGVVGDTSVVVGTAPDGGHWAVEATCTHYGGPLGEGLYDGETLRCPWHHARFAVPGGHAVAAPAFDGLQAHETRVEGDRLFVGDAIEGTPPARPSRAPGSVVILGGGAAGYAAIDELRGRGYQGALTLISEDPRLPYDRPNLSKDYLAGDAPEEWMPLREDEFYTANEVELRTGVRATRIDPEQRLVVLEDGESVPYEALLLATGSTPIQLPEDGDPGVPIGYLRSRADADRLIELAQGATSAAVLGASFIGTEVAASLRKRGVEVTVVDQDSLPMGRILGDELAGMVRSIHEEHGVTFKLGRSVERVAGGEVVLDDGSTIKPDLVVVGFGVRPNVSLAEEAGLHVDHGVVVDSRLRTSAPRIWAAGDIASWPDARSGEQLRVEHWVVAERQGQAAARNILGFDEPFEEVPFFWSAHYDVQINYVGHAVDWDEARWSGDLEGREGLVSFRRDGRVLAVATIGRDRASLEAERAFETGDAAALDGLGS